MILYILKILGYLNAKQRTLFITDPCLGFSGHKHMKSEKVVAFTDRNCYVLWRCCTIEKQYHI